MLAFFISEKDLDIDVYYNNCIKKVHLNKNQEKDPTDNPECCYLTTAPDLCRITRAHEKNSLLDKGLIKIVDPELVISNSKFKLPYDLTFKDNLEYQLEPLVHKEEVRIAIINGMPNAIGDHIVGMKAYEIWYKHISKILQGKINIDLLQATNILTEPITSQWKQYYQQTIILPINLKQLLEYDAIVDLGAFLEHPLFNKLPMIDFFMKALSLDYTQIPAEEKRNKLKTKKEADQYVEEILANVKFFKKPILLFHHASSSPIRSIPDHVSRELVKHIIDNTNYFVISLSNLEFEYSHYINLSPYCINVDHLMSFVKNVDSIVTVDTCIYHIADAFDKPSVVIFTGIEPELRIKYYPYTTAITLEKPGGILYGKHKLSMEKNLAKKEINRLKEITENIDKQLLSEKIKEVNHGNI